MRFSTRGRVRIVDLEYRLFGTSLSLLQARLSYRRDLERVWNLIENDYDNSDLSLLMAARQGGISRNHLNVVLRGHTTLSFHQLLNRYRLLQASKMMMSKDYSLLEVSLGTGFGTLNTMERQAKAILGVTPSQLRILLRDGDGLPRR